MNRMTWDEFSTRYCKTQVSTPEMLAENMNFLVRQYSPVGFFLAEGQLMGASWCGQVVAAPYGPRNTLKEIPAHPFSPRGLASDMSVAIGHVLVEDIPTCS